jgi:hypothetical protein
MANNKETLPLLNNLWNIYSDNYADKKEEVNKIIEENTKAKVLKFIKNLFIESFKRNLNKSNFGKINENRIRIEELITNISKFELDIKNTPLNRILWLLELMKEIWLIDNKEFIIDFIDNCIWDNKEFIADTLGWNHIWDLFKNPSFCILIIELCSPKTFDFLINKFPINWSFKSNILKNKELFEAILSDKVNQETKVKILKTLINNDKNILVAWKNSIEEEKEEENFFNVKNLERILWSIESDEEKGNIIIEWLNSYISNSVIKFKPLLWVLRKNIKDKKILWEMLLYFYFLSYYEFKSFEEEDLEYINLINWEEIFEIIEKCCQINSFSTVYIGILENEYYLKLLFEKSSEDRVKEKLISWCKSHIISKKICTEEKIFNRILNLFKDKNNIKEIIFSIVSFEDPDDNKYIKEFIWLILSLGFRNSWKISKEIYLEIITVLKILYKNFSEFDTIEEYNKDLFEVSDENLIWFFNKALELNEELFINSFAKINTLKILVNKLSFENLSEYLRKISNLDSLIVFMTLNLKNFYNNLDEKYKDLFYDIIINDIKKYLMVEYSSNIHQYICFCEEMWWRFKDILPELYIHSFNKDVKNIRNFSRLLWIFNYDESWNINEENLDISRKIELNNNNYIDILSLYCASEVDENPANAKEEKEKILYLLSQENPESWKNKKFILDKFKEVYSRLITKWSESLSQKELVFINLAQTTWVWNLSQIEKLIDFISKINKDEAGESKELKKLLREFQNKTSWIRNWWDIEDTTFYWISADILEMDLELYLNHSKVLNKIPNKLLKEYLNNTLNLLFTEIILAWDNEDFKRSIIKNLLEKIEKWDNIKIIIQEENQRVEDSIKILFQDKFWIIKIPENIDESIINSIISYSKYLANLNERNEEKEAILWFFLALKINNKWSDFRMWKEINLREYITEKNFLIISEIIKTRNENEFFKQLTWWEENEKKAIQEDTILQTLWDIQSVDILLSSILENSDELLDEDIYEWDEKLIINLLKKHWKSLWIAISQKFQELSWKWILDENSQIIIKELEEIFWIKEWNKENIDDLKNLMNWLSPTLNFTWKIPELKIQDDINKLNELKKPNDEIIAIFKKLWEEFYTDSWVLPISNDINYLRKITDKWFSDFSITAEEKVKVLKYLEEVEKQINKLSERKNEIEKLFKNLEKQLENSKNIILRTRVIELWKIINKKETEDWKVNIVSTITCNLEMVIRHIRACLWCNTKEVNNDTNLSFWNPNRFFIYSSIWKSDKSISDQLVTIYSSEIWNLFVMDNLYWEKNIDIYFVHIMTLIKKIKNIWNWKFSKILLPKSSFPKDYIESLWKKLKNTLWEDGITLEENEKIKINILKPTFSDWYNDFNELWNVDWYWLWRQTWEKEIWWWVLTIN